MLLKYTALNFKEPISFNTKYKSLYYKTSIRFMPFLSKNINLETTDIEKITTPLAHFEFSVNDIEDSIYNSFFLMPYQLLDLIEDKPLIGINEIASLIIQENGFTQRIDNYLKTVSTNSQLTLF